MDPLVFIVPLGFLAIWALTAIFNRDANLPARNPNAHNPYAARPVPTARPVPPRPLETSPPLRQTQPPIRWAPQDSPPRRAPQATGNDDDIIIIEAPRPASKPNQGKGVGSTRRGRQKPSTASKSTPSVQPRAGFEGVAQNVNQQLTSSLALSPLSEQAGPSSVQSVGTASAMPMSSTNPRARTLSIMAALSDPARVREAMLVNELLQPPLSLRGRRL